MLAPLLCLALAAAPAPIDDEAVFKEARVILAELVAADTTNPPGNEARAVKLIAKRLKRAGIPFEVTTFEPGRDNLVARLRGDGSERPLLLIAHLDVVGTAGQAWTVPPHTLTEKDGYLYGRGVGDDLGMAAVDLALCLALQRARVPLRRDLIVAFTGDEESGGAGARWLIANRRQSLDAEVAFNEGGGPLLTDDGKIELLQLQTAEKTYQDFTVSTVGTTGHSSVPLPDNAIVELAEALVGIASHPFPDRLLPVTRASLAGRAPFEAAPLGPALARLAQSSGALPAADLDLVRQQPSLAAQLHTTCSPTLLTAGTRENALPASASANVNCRLLPDETIAAVTAQLQDAAGSRAKVSAVKDFGSAGPSPLEGPGPNAVRRAGEAIWPGVKLVPTMSAGADDSRFLRAAGIQAYGFLPIALSDADDRRAHGLDERIPVSSLRTGVALFRHLILELNRPPK